MIRQDPKAFTLVELLVVITIIVVLLALLTPALDKAIYQAELLQCGANLHATAVGATSYAMEHKRRYPYRPGVHHPDWIWRDANIKLVPPFGDNDDRPIIRDHIQINANLNCPLNKWIDLEASVVNTEAAYQLWFGFQFGRGLGGSEPEQGMTKLGDRLSFTDGSGRRSRFGLLVSDIDDVGEGSWVFGSHPETDEPIMEQDWEFNGPVFTISRWYYGGAMPNRGPIDRNFGYTDGSTSRIVDISIEDARQEEHGLIQVPITNNKGSFPTEFTTLPKG